MPSYAITGASRGIGWELARNLSSDPSNTVIGLVRNKPATDKRVAEELSDRTNVHILQADITDLQALKAAAVETAQITGGGLDYLIGNGAFLSTDDAYDPISVLDQEDPKKFEALLLTYFQTNVIGNIHLFSTFTPLILKGTAKKVIHITSGHAYTDLYLDNGVDVSPAYTISKAAANAATAKFSAEYSKHGVLFLNVCPGVVDTGHFDGLTEEQQRKIGPTLKVFAELGGPSFKGPRPVQDSVKDILAVIESKSVANGDGGRFYSHKGDTKTWIS
ncbi:uncharacterized protein BDV17DRAFT_294487 [Aspergillus undulatus]|uniref:uncharacterized protein n=1 Tax=Aspergillus undulatus TaxID=1810928 RepID=UPI003CCD77EA